MCEVTKKNCFQYFSGNASPLQRKLIAEWLEEGLSNQELFYQWLAEWEAAHVQFRPDVEIASAAIMNRIDNDAGHPVMATKTDSTRRALFTFSVKWQIAAALIFVIAISGYFMYDAFRYIKYNTAYGQIKEFDLGDGSHVVLNANSSLSVPRWGFGKYGRNVLLDGEAAFSVVHTKESARFSVHTNAQIKVEVLGTEFSVYSRNGSNKVELKKGAVKLLFTKKPSATPVLMKPGDIASVTSKGNFVLGHKQSLPNYRSWKEHRFSFDNTPLPEAIQELEEFFGVRIRIEGVDLINKKLTGSFKAESSDELLAVLSEMFDFDINTRGDSIILK